ncbi:MAG: hypothetical protein LBS45_12115 [Synergistaceae bacterium]|jgi:hypothetical protein|nr:hypothetical protein [Synergistaceae bacterium]
MAVTAVKYKDSRRNTSSKTPYVEIHGTDIPIHMHLVSERDLEILKNGGVALYQSIWLSALSVGVPCLINAWLSYDPAVLDKTFLGNALIAAASLSIAAVVYYLGNKTQEFSERVYKDIVSSRNERI